MVMPTATAPIGNKICMEASRPLMPPVEVSKERELHSRNGATLPCCSFSSVFRRDIPVVLWLTWRVLLGAAPLLLMKE